MPAGPLHPFKSELPYHSENSLTTLDAFQIDEHWILGIGEGQVATWLLMPTVQRNPLSPLSHSLVI